MVSEKFVSTRAMRCTGLSRRQRPMESAMVERALSNFAVALPGIIPSIATSSRCCRHEARPHERKGHSLIKAGSRVPAGLPGLPRLPPGSSFVNTKSPGLGGSTRADGPCGRRGHILFEATGSHAKGRRAPA